MRASKTRGGAILVGSVLAAAVQLFGTSPSQAMQVDLEGMKADLQTLNEKGREIKPEMLVRDFMKYAGEMEPAATKLKQKLEAAEALCDRDLIHGARGDMKAVITKVREKSHILAETIRKAREDRELQRYAGNDNVRMKDVTPIGEATVTGVNYAMREVSESHGTIEPKIKEQRDKLDEEMSKTREAVIRESDSFGRLEEQMARLEDELKNLYEKRKDTESNKTDKEKDYKQAVEERKKARIEYLKLINQTPPRQLREYEEWLRDQKKAREEYDRADQRKDNLHKQVLELEKRLNEIQNNRIKTCEQIQQTDDAMEKSEESQARLHEPFEKASLERAKFEQVFGKR